MYLGLLESIERCLYPAKEGYEPAIIHIECLARVMDSELGNRIIEGLTSGPHPFLEEIEEEFRIELAGIWGWVCGFEGHEYVNNPYQGTEAEKEAWANGWRQAGFMKEK